MRLKPLKTFVEPDRRSRVVTVWTGLGGRLSAKPRPVAVKSPPTATA